MDRTNDAHEDNADINGSRKAKAAWCMDPQVREAAILRARGRSVPAPGDNWTHECMTTKLSIMHQTCASSPAHMNVCRTNHVISKCTVTITQACSSHRTPQHESTVEVDAMVVQG